MANLVEFLVRIKDMASGPLQKIAGSGASSFSKLENSVGKVTQKLNTLGMNISQIDAKLESLRKTREISFDSRQINRINKEIETLQSKKDRLEGGRSGGGLASMFRTGLAIAGIGSLAYLGKDIMQAGMGRQLDLTSLQTLVGVQAGNLLNAQLVDFAKKSIYGNEVFTEGKLMAGSGVKAGNIMPIMKMVGDLAMGDKERMKSIVLAFAEASSTGHLNGRQELIMRTALFNPLESMQKMTGKSGAQLAKDMEKGKISIDMLVKSMEYATGPAGRWHNMMQKLQETPAGKWTAFTGTLSTLAGTIGLALLPALGHLTDFMTILINNAPALYGVATAIGAMTAAWILYTAWVERAAIWQTILEALAYWPLALVGAVAGAFGYLMAKNKEASDGAVNSASVVNNAFTMLSLTLEKFIYWIELAWLHTQSFFERLGNMSVAMQTLNPKNFWKALTGPTEAGGKIDDLVNKHMWHEIDALNGLDDKGNKKKGISPLDIANGKFTPDGAGKGGALGADTTNTITGGGVRNITINVAKFQDKTEIHTANIREGVHELEEIIRDMFLRVTNSAATAMS